MRQVGDDLRQEPGANIRFNFIGKPTEEYKESQHWSTYKQCKIQERLMKYCSAQCTPGSEGWTKETDECASACTTKFNAAFNLT